MLACLVATVLVACQPGPPTTRSPAPAETGATLATSHGSSEPSLDPSLIGATFGSDPLIPTLGNGGYDVTSYEIDVETDPLDNETTLRVVIEAVATQRLGRFSLDYSGIPAGSTTVDDLPAPFAESGGKLTITMPHVIDEGASFRTVVEISGRPNAVRGRGWTWRPSEQVSAYGIYDALPLWLPTNADPADKASIETRVTVPLPYSAVAPGVLVSATDVAAGRAFHWRAGPSSQFSIVVRDYAVADLGTVAGIPLTSYEPKHLSERDSEALAVIPGIFEHFTEIYGPFPFESLSVVWVDGLTDMEGPDEGLLKWGPERREPRAIAHHLTHLWFMVNVTPRTSRESYLRAAFANYGDLLWIEHADGVAARDRRMAAMHASLGARTDPPAEPSRIAGNPALFDRGPLSLHALRVIVGDTTFFEILRSWVVRHHRQAATVDDFVAHCEEVADRSLDDWSRRWLHEEAVPPLDELGIG